MWMRNGIFFVLLLSELSGDLINSDDFAVVEDDIEETDVCFFSFIFLMQGKRKEWGIFFQTSFTVDASLRSIVQLYTIFFLFYHIISTPSFHHSIYFQCVFP